MHFSGAATADMESCIKPTLQRNTDEVILHIGTSGLRSKKRTTGTRKQYYGFMEIASSITDLWKSQAVLSIYG